jgi:hypothetical protein
LTSIANTLEYLRRNAIALAALGCALLALAGGTYAAVSLPRGSVGPQQLNHKLIGGYVRAWATITSSNRVVGSSGGAQVRSGPASGLLTVSWRGKFPRSRTACTAMVTTTSGPGFSQLVAFYEGRGSVEVGSADGILPSEISVAVLC